jgi:hypothetical protein
VGGQLRERLAEVEVVGELGAVGLLAGADRRHQPALRPHLLAQLADQVRVLGEALDEDRAGTVQRRRDVGHALLRVDEHGGGRLRVDAGVGEQPVGKRLQPGLAGDLRLGAPLGLVRQVDVLQPGLRVGRHDLRLERVVELALAADGLQDRGPPLLQLAQVAQAFLEGTQLGVVEGAGDLLAVPGDERHGRPAVEQVDRGGHLPLADPELFGDALVDGDGGGRHDEHSAPSVPGRRAPVVRAAPPSF